MMKISSVSGNHAQAAQMGMPQAEDSISKNLQRQIADAQKRLQELSANKEMSLEEKLKKRQEIQKQIADLNNQLRQHQVEQRREKQQEQKTSMKDIHAGTRAANRQGKQRTGFSRAGMQAMISAGSSMNLAKVQGSVATRMEGRAGVLESEIKLDAARGSSVEAKQEELAKVEQAAVNAAGWQVSALGEANKAMEGASEAEKEGDMKKDTTDSAAKAEEKNTGLERTGAEGYTSEGKPLKNETEPTVSVTV